MRVWLVICMCLIVVTPARAFTFGDGSGEKTRTILDYIEDYVDVPDGALDWKMFGRTEEEKVRTTTEDGYDLQYSRPVFQPEMEALDGTDVTIKGYIFPLEGTDKQKLFLFGPFPLSCPYQYHVGPALVIEVHAEDHPVKFDYDPVTLTGRLELVHDDPDYSVFYRLRDAKEK